MAENEITIVFSTENCLHYPDLRIKTSGGKYQDYSMPLSRLHTNLINIIKTPKERIKKA